MSPFPLSQREKKHRFYHTIFCDFSLLDAKKGKAHQPRTDAYYSCENAMTTTRRTSANDAVVALEKSLEKTPPLGRKKQKKGEDKENVIDYSNGVVMGASNDDDVDAKSATEL